MATEIGIISEFLKTAGIRFETDGRVIKTGFCMRTYRNISGLPLLPLVIIPDEEGEFIEVVAPYCYVCTETKNFPAVVQACNEAMRTLKMVRFEFDHHDGEIRVEVHLPIEDGALTRRQLLRALFVVPEAIERFDDMIRMALENGEVIDLEEDRRAVKEPVYSKLVH